MKENQEHVILEEIPKESKLMRKVKESPFMSIGIIGCAGAVAYGFYNFKKRGDMSPSVYLMHLRVKAQGMVVGALAIGVGFNIIKQILDSNSEDKK